ncbi:MAG TPA: hypothetical protein VLJ88_00205, partial [Propionibacteriaceae bacterium]|nr:hypothetical protein [Propionibacteriaceae bacterium]
SGDTPVPVAVARISTLGYFGSFTAPAVIGYLAAKASLPTALLLPAIALVATAFAAPVVRPPRRQARPSSVDPRPTKVRKDPTSGRPNHPGGWSTPSAAPRTIGS